MSGDKNSNIHIPSVFLQRPGAEVLRTLLSKGDKVQVLLTWIPKYPDEETTGSEGGEEVTTGEEKKETGMKEPGDQGQKDSDGQDGEECSGGCEESEQDRGQCNGGHERLCGGGGSSLFDDGQSNEEHEKT